MFVGLVHSRKSRDSTCGGVNRDWRSGSKSMTNFYGWALYFREKPGREREFRRGGSQVDAAGRGGAC